ncbi:MAG: hypothetical protein IT299_01215 [Dehalococcoidia bacterium]|nr:hypothetical protein [Dehalococcoidia bacterium]
MRLHRLVVQATGIAAASVLVACAGGGSDAGGTSATAVGTSKAATTATASPQARAVGLDSAFGTNGVAQVPLAANAHSRFMAVATGSDGKTYGAGFVASGTDQALAVARFDAKGALDKTFGTEGVAQVNVAIGGKAAEIARAVAVQADGKVVVAGPVEHDPTGSGDAARDTDVAVARFDATGKLDAGFGRGGVAVLDFGTGRPTSATAFGGDTSWGMAVTADRVIVFGSKLNDAPDRTDTDFVLAALTPAGQPDTGFGSNGRLVVDVSNASDNPRGLLTQPDGKLVASGYSSISGVVQPVLIRIDGKGVLDASFGKDGVATAKILDGVTEAYNVQLQGTDYVLAGYGRGADTAEKVDLVVYRFKANGTHDTSFGTNGVTRLDIAKEDDRARNVLVLPDGGILAVGSGKKDAANIDGMMVMLTKDGAFNERFGTKGYLISDLGGPADAWYGVALSSDKSAVIVAGYKGTDAASGGFDSAVLARVTI